VANLVVDIRDQRLDNLGFDALVIDVGEVCVYNLKHDVQRKLR